MGKQIMKGCSHSERKYTSMFLKAGHVVSTHSEKDKQSQRVRERETERERQREKETRQRITVVLKFEIYILHGFK